MSQPLFSHTGAHRLCLLALSAIVLAMTHAPAVAQQPAAMVNGEPITELDVSQRSRLLQLVTRKPVTPQAALDELIDEKLKLQTAKRYRLDVSDADVESSFSTMARRVGVSAQQFSNVLGQSGINVNAFKTKIRADIAWQQIVRGKFRENLQIRERDVLTELQSRNKNDPSIVGYEYTLRPILLIVPRGASEGAREARRREAEGLRTRFQGCAEGVRLARSLKDVAIRDSIIRTTADFPGPLREILDRTEVGSLTPPETTAQGVEFYAVCGKKKTVGALPGRREIQDEMLQERFETQGKRYLRELRRSAMIEYR